jgi:hypothetical protein
MLSTLHCFLLHFTGVSQSAAASAAADSRYQSIECSCLNQMQLFTCATNLILMLVQCGLRVASVCFTLTWAAAAVHPTPIGIACCRPPSKGVIKAHSTT